MPFSCWFDFFNMDHFKQLSSVVIITFFSPLGNEASWIVCWWAFELKFYYLKVPVFLAKAQNTKINCLWRTKLCAFIMGFTKCLWHNIHKLHYLKWDQIMHHLSPSIVNRGGQNWSLFIYQLLSLLNYWLFNFSRFSWCLCTSKSRQLSTEELKFITCHLSASYKQWIYHYYKTSGSTLKAVSKLMWLPCINSSIISLYQFKLSAEEVIIKTNSKEINSN